MWRSPTRGDESLQWMLAAPILSAAAAAAAAEDDDDGVADVALLL